MKSVCRGVRYLSGGVDNTCQDEGTGDGEHGVGHSAGHGAGHSAGHGAEHVAADGLGHGAGHEGMHGEGRGGGGLEPTFVRGSSRAHQNVHDKSRSQDAVPPTGR